MNDYEIEELTMSSEPVDFQSEEKILRAQLTELNQKLKMRKELDKQEKSAAREARIIKQEEEGRDRTRLIATLISEGKDYFQNSVIDFDTGDFECEKHLANLRETPHFFVLACIMDRGIPADRAWRIPFQISRNARVKDASFEAFLALSADDLAEIFRDDGIQHRYGQRMTRYFYDAIQLIKTEYGGNASNIWDDVQNSATVIRRFLQFNGVGLKLATMATNILARKFKVPFVDLSAIDISPDIHVSRFLKYHGFVRTEKREEIIYWAREHHPEYPGVFDEPCFRRGRQLEAKGT